MLERCEELRGLQIQAGFMQVEEALQRISPGQSAGTRAEQRILVAHGVDNEAGGNERVLNALKRRIQALDKIQIQWFAGAVQRDIKPRRADQIEFGMVMFCAQNAADGKTGRIQFFQAAQVSIDRARLAGMVDKPNGRTVPTGHGKQLRELILREPA